jgi:hypothetical protein
MFTVYFDGSGAPDDTNALTVAGFIAPTNQWLRFDRKWNKCLSDYGVSALHMKDYCHSQREFASWKGDEKKRRRFIGRLIRIIKSCVSHSFGCAVGMEDYRKVDAQFQLSERVKPYGLTGITCIYLVGQWAQMNSVPFKDILFVFEKGDKDANNLRALAEQELKLDLLFWPKEKSIAFQAADLLAYEHLQIAKKLVTLPDEEKIEYSELRGSFKSLSNVAGGGRDAKWWRVHDEQGLIGHCVKYGYARR